MVDPAILRAMLKAGCTAEQIVAVAEDAAREDEAKKTAKRAKNAERQRRFRERNAMSRVTDVTNGDTPVPDKEAPHTPKEINPTPVVCSSPAREGFADFWEIYPHKVGKRDALKAFERATARAPLETIFAGLRRYVAKTDDRPWCNPATWLNQDRWDDAPATVTPQARGSPPQPKTMTQVIDERLKRYEQARESEYTHTIDADLSADGDDSDAPAVYGFAAAARH